MLAHQQVLVSVWMIAECGEAARSGAILQRARAEGFVVVGARARGGLKSRCVHRRVGEGGRRDKVMSLSMYALPIRKLTDL